MVTILKKFWILIAILLVVALSFGGFVQGYRIGPYGLPVKATKLIIERVPVGTTIYLDGIREHVTKDTPVSLFVMPNSHSLIINAEGYQPWNELITAVAGVEMYIHPLLIKEALTENLLEDSERVRATTQLLHATLPTKDAPLILAGGCTKIYVSQNRIVAEKHTSETCVTPPPYLCSDETVAEFGACLPTLIFEPKEAMRNVFAYPSRDDALIVTSGNSVYVLELDPREPRFFAPLARGAGIRAAAWSPTSIIISHESGASELPL